MAVRVERFEVTGPGLEGRPAPCHGAAVALALDRASRFETPASFYVRDAGAIVAQAEGNGRGAAELVRLERR